VQDCGAKKVESRERSLINKLNGKMLKF
jgi:hypothetical protein